MRFLLCRRSVIITNRVIIYIPTRIYINVINDIRSIINMSYLSLTMYEHLFHLSVLEKWWINSPKPLLSSTISLSQELLLPTNEILLQNYLVNREYSVSAPPSFLQLYCYYADKDDRIRPTVSALVVLVYIEFTVRKLSRCSSSFQKYPWVL